MRQTPRAEEIDAQQNVLLQRLKTQSEVSPVGPVGPVGFGPGTSEGSARQSAVLALLPLVGGSLFE